MNLPSFLRPFVNRTARLEREINRNLARRKAERLAKFAARSEASKRGWAKREGRA